jgi:uncharacterized protein (TIRG00374 family)
VSDTPQENGNEPPPKSWLQREWRLVVGLTLSVICIYLALRGLSLEALRAALSTPEWGWVLLAVAVVVAGTVLKAIRWRALFFPQHLGLGKAWAVFMIGQMLNIVFPARAGDLGRIYLIGEEPGISRAKALSTVVVEKMVDLVMLALAFLIVAAWLLTTPVGLQDWLRQAGATVLPIAVVALGALMVLAYAGRPVWQFLRRLLNPLSLRWRSAAERAMDQAIAGFESLRRWQTSVKVWTLSLLIWLLAALTNMLIFRAFELSLSPYVAVLLLVVLMSGVSVPRLPGNLGVFPYLCQLVLSLFGVSRETGLVYGIVLQVVVNLPLIVLGSASMLWENWSLRHSPATDIPEQQTVYDEAQGHQIERLALSDEQ